MFLLEEGDLWYPSHPLVFTMGPIIFHAHPKQGPQLNLSRLAFKNNLLSTCLQNRCYSRPPSQCCNEYNLLIFYEITRLEVGNNFKTFMIQGLPKKIPVQFKFLINLLLYKINHLPNATQKAFTQDLNKCIDDSFVTKFILICYVINIFIAIYQHMKNHGRHES